MRNTSRNENRDLKILCKEVIQWAQGAGKITRRHQRKLGSLTISRKVALGVVSNADLASEDYLLKKIRTVFKHDSVLAEESSYQSYRSKTAILNSFAKKEWCWTVDPLDGTTNFLNGMDYYSIAIALLHFGKPVLGVVYRPSNGDCFYAYQGGGAYFSNLKEKRPPMRLNPNPNSKNIRDTLLVTGFAGEKGQTLLSEFTHFKKLVQTARGVRRLGSAALDLCYVSRGIFDGFWESGLGPWDVAAAGIICLEAGVNVADFKGNEFSPFQSSIIAARPPLFKSLFKFIKK
ncbi:MAG: inositol monophosphatase [Bdellovibrio sp.]|nr:inositol monophosphatase [Bdellovibrio sp.]